MAVAVGRTWTCAAQLNMQAIERDFNAGVLPYWNGLELQPCP